MSVIFGVEVLLGWVSVSGSLENDQAQLPYWQLLLDGLFLGLGFILTGELAIPIGLHIAWNFAQGYVFGFPVSGADENLSLIATQQTGPIAWTGGAYGPEGGLMGVFALLLGMLLVYGWMRWTRHGVSVQSRLAEYLPFHHEIE